MLTPAPGCLRSTQVKTIEGHYTGHFKAVVTKPQNVMVMRDVACAGYVAHDHDVLRLRVYHISRIPF